MATYPLSEAYVDGDILTAANVNSITEGVNDLAIAVVQTAKTASYTLVLADAAQLIQMNVASANDLSIPTNASVAFPIGTQILIYQAGAGQTSIVAVTPGTTTVRAQGSKNKIAGQYGIAGILKIATDEWIAFGNLVA
jgi:hypothetical protein